MKGLAVSDGVMVLSFAALIIGLGLVHIAAALIIPSSLLLALGFRKGWY